MEHALPVNPLTQPHLWAMLPSYTEEELYNAFLRLQFVPEWQVVLTQLVVTYLLSHPEDIRGVGKQDVIREMLDMQQRALLWRKAQTTERGGEEHGRDAGNEWFPAS